MDWTASFFISTIVISAMTTVVLELKVEVENRFRHEFRKLQIIKEQLPSTFVRLNVDDSIILDGKF